MKKNVGDLDKGVRIFLGFMLVAVGIVVPMGVAGRVVSFVLAGVALLTGFFNF